MYFFDFYPGKQPIFKDGTIFFGLPGIIMYNLLQKSLKPHGLSDYSFMALFTDHFVAESTIM